MAATTTQREAIARIAGDAEHRGGLEARRADGAFFTDHDVALHLARRGIGGVLLEAAGVEPARVDLALAANRDVVAQLVQLARANASVREAVAARLATLRVLDPSCGAGAFLVAAWQVIAELADDLELPRPDPALLQGVDIDAGAVAACRATLELVTGTPGAGSGVAVGDAQDVGQLPAADVVLGNPPFVRARADARHADLATRRVPNRSAWIVERALAAAAPGARVSFVLPISTSCTDAFVPARQAWSRACSSVLASHFDTIPCSLFTGVVQRLSIYEGRRNRASEVATDCSWFTSRYHRWTRSERAGLLERVRHVPLPPQSVGGSIAKVGTALEADLLERLFVHPPAGRCFAARDDGGGNRIRYKRRWSYFLLLCDFVPGIWDADGTPREPTELKSIAIDPALDARVLLAAYSSTLFWWYFSAFTDNRNVNRRDLAAFPLPDLDEASAARLADLGSELMAALRACAEVRTCTYRSIGTIRNTYFRQAATRPVLDRIDRELAQAYGMSDAQLQFVLDFERRFRS